MELEHPLRNAKVIIYQKINESEGPEFIGKYEPFKTYPIFFHGKTVDDVEKMAKEFTDKAVAEFETNYWKNKETYNKRVAGMKKAREAKKT